MPRDLDWRNLVGDIELLATTGCYERVNKIMSLGLVNSLRRLTARLIAESNGFYADLGAGPGTSGKIILKELPSDSILVLVDPSIPMLMLSLDSIPNDRVLRLGGLFETLPFKDSTIDGITAMFSYRDAVDYHKALDEIARVLKADGRLAILDFYRHGSSILHGLIKLYLYAVIPLALLLSRCPGRLEAYKSFLTTLDKMLTREELLEALNERFRLVRVFDVAPGVAIFYARGPRK